jgi:hypothetical protein
MKHYILDNTSFFLRNFIERPPWWGGDLQTLRNALVSNLFGRDGGEIGAASDERIDFPAGDGSGDVLLGRLNRPAPETDDERRRPLIVLIHGLTGHEDSRYNKSTARHMLTEGFPVLRLNLRGAGPSGALCRGSYHAGRSEDLRLVLGRMDGRLAAGGIVLVGFSLGGNMLLKYLAEQGSRAPVLGAVSVSAPIDLKATQVRMMARRNRWYHDFMLKEMKAEIARPTFPLSEDERAGLASIRTVFEFDDRIVAPGSGFAGADDYYAKCSAKPMLGAIRTPTLLIHARNDPWIPGAIYDDVPGMANARLTLLMAPGGGHVGFHGIGGAVPWHDRCIAVFAARLAGIRMARR